MSLVLCALVTDFDWTMLDNLNIINQLKDPQVFVGLIEEEINARSPIDPKEAKSTPRIWNQRPTLNASVVADR
jgi:hypothetical protein